MFIGFTKNVIVALLLFCVASVCFAQKSYFRDQEVSLKFQNTPVFRFSNEANIDKGFNKWLVIGAKFTAVERKVSKDKYMWLDNIVVQFDVLLPSSHRGRNVFALMSGQAVYWAIPMDGKSHVLEGYMPPQILKRYLRSGVKIKKALLSRLDARVSFYTKERRLLGRYYTVRKGESLMAVARRFARASDTVAGGMIYVKNSIYPRNKTPWQYIGFSSHDLIKLKSETPSF